MGEVVNVSKILEDKYWIARPLQTILSDEEEIRLNFVTDDISKRSLLGGVATALILATLLCKKNGWTLRIITRYFPCNLNDYYNFIALYRLESPLKVEAFSDERKDNDAINFKLPVGSKEVYMATSWWSAKSILDSNVCDRLLYIIQEEETFFYPYSDDRYWCEQIMNDERIDYIVNSKLLFDYLNSNQYKTLCSNAKFFEPAFPDFLYEPSKNSFMKKDEKRKLFFYGRPMNPRNLYYFGLECLDEALLEGIIDTNLWDIYLAGYNESGDIRFTNGYMPKMNGQMDWEKYAQFAGEIDVALSLMYTPHPSYPPFDMCCSGAIVVTNEFSNKKDLNYSSNMILKPLDKESIKDGLREAVKLAENVELRKYNYEHMNICRDWEDALKDIIEWVSNKVKEGAYV